MSNKNVPKFQGTGLHGCEYCLNTFPTKEVVNAHKEKQHNHGGKPDKKSFAPAKAMKKSRGKLNKN